MIVSIPENCIVFIINIASFHLNLGSTCFVKGYFVGLAILFQWFLSGKYFNFPYPITLTMIHMGFSGAVAFCLIRILKV